MATLNTRLSATYDSASSGVECRASTPTRPPASAPPPKAAHAAALGSPRKAREEAIRWAGRSDSAMPCACVPCAGREGEWRGHAPGRNTQAPVRRDGRAVDPMSAEFEAGHGPMHVQSVSWPTGSVPCATAVPRACLRRQRAP